MFLPTIILSPTRNHDGRRPNLATDTIEATTTENERRHHTTTNPPDGPCLTWTQVVHRPHPNRQHLPFTEGRGSSSSKRYRRRTAKRHRYPLQNNYNATSDTYQRITNTLRKVHNRHRSFLIPSHYQTNNNSTSSSLEDTDNHIDRIIHEFNNLSEHFDNIARNIENQQDNHTVADDTSAQYYHQYFADTDAILQQALDLFALEIDLAQHDQTPTDTQELPPSHFHDDDLSIDEANYDISELINLYSGSTDTNNQHNTARENEPTLLELLSNYLPPKQPLHLPILPPTDIANQNTSNDENHPPFKEQHTTPTPPPPLISLPILPPLLPSQPKPTVDPPTNWTHDPTYNSYYHQHIYEPFCHDITDHQTIHYDDHYTNNIEETLHHNQTQDQFHHPDILENTHYANDMPADLEDQHGLHSELLPLGNFRLPPPTTSSPKPAGEPRQGTYRKTYKRKTTIAPHKNPKTFDNHLHFITQNARGLPADDNTKLQSIIHQMRENNWAAVPTRDMETRSRRILHRRIQGHPTRPHGEN